MSGSESAQPAKRSKVEVLKEQSQHLRGSLPTTVESDATHFSEDEYQLLKFHGVYQQDDRDQRMTARAEGREREWIMMVRAKIPGGLLTPEQYLAFDRISTDFADGTLRLTTRQCFQLHHILKRNLKHTIRSMNDALITTLGACGDVERNLMACPAPDTAADTTDIQRIAGELSDLTLPRTHAYHEIWLNDTKVVSTEDEADPLYRENYLPRKFKSAITVEGDNCLDMYSQDVGIVAHLDEGKLAGFTILAGGGMSLTHGKSDTHPRLADPICFVTPEELTPTFLTIIEIQRDHGNRADRRYARMKYLFDDWGVERFKQEMERRLGRALLPPRPLTWHAGDHLGWNKQHDGRWYLGVWVENGRLRDSDDLTAKSAFRELVEQFKPGIRLTSQQNIIFTDIKAEDRAAVERLLRGHGITLAGDLPAVLANSMACPAMPTCGLAIAESERALPSVIRDFHRMMESLGLGDERLSVRMTGCPNGCARPFLGDIGFVGRSADKYQIYVGGDFEGTRLNTLFADLVPRDELVSRLQPLFLAFRAERHANEGFGNFCHRVGLERLQSLQPQPVAI